MRVELPRPAYQSHTIAGGGKQARTQYRPIPQKLNRALESAKFTENHAGLTLRPHNKGLTYTSLGTGIASLFSRS
jgi:hypothetical protein